MLSPNTYLQNRYRIIRILGKGGMGHVYEAIDEAVECIVAIKETVVDSDNLRRAFEREAKLLANLKHPVLPRVTHYFFEEDRQYLVMDFIEGLNLMELLVLRHRPFTYDEILPWTDELLKALEYLHNRSEPVVHRDIKPANIKLSKDGQIYLLDFGLAKGTAGQMSVEQTGNRGISIFGYTEAYASPEQLYNSGTDTQSDLYSFGATLYHLLTGQVPVSSARRDIKISQDQPDPLLAAHLVNSQVPHPLSLVLSHSMMLDRSARITSASIMRRALQEARLAIEANHRRSEPQAQDLLTTNNQPVWQETHLPPPEHLMRPADEAPSPVARSTMPAEQNMRTIRVEPSSSNAPLSIPEGQPVEPSINSAEVSWPSQITSEAENAQLVSSPAEQEARQRAEEEERRRIEEEARRRDEEEAASRARAEEEEARRRAEEAEQRQRQWAEQEARRREAEEQEAASRRGIEEDEALRRRAAGLVVETAKQPRVRRSKTFLYALAGVGLVALLVAVVLLFPFRRSAPPEADNSIESASVPRVSVTNLRGRANQPLPPMRLSRKLAGQQGITWAVAFSPDGRTLVSASEDHKVRLWDAQSWKPTRTLEGHEAGVNSVAVSPDGKMIASGSNDRTVKLWDARDGRPLKTLNGHSDEVYFVAFSPDGRQLASAGKDRTIRLWNAQSGASIRTLKGHTDLVWAIVFAPDGKLLASASRDRSVRLWDTESGRETRNLAAHSSPIIAVAFSHDGKILACGSDDKSIKLWDTETWQEGKTLSGHDSYITSLAFTPDDRSLASASNDQTVIVWNVETGELRQKLKGHSKGVNAVAFSPDGTTLVSGSKDETVKVWQ